MTDKPELVITRGLPASGKSTFAKQWVDHDREHRARVNRDDLRRMVDDGVFIKGVTEQRIQAVRNSAVHGLLKRGVSVVVDDTNLPNRVCRDLVQIAWTCRADWRIEDFTTVPLATCIARNEVRKDKDPVPRHVLEDMHMRFIHGRETPLAFSPDVIRPTASNRIADFYEPDESLPKAFICDIDGTVALRGDRDPYDETRVSEDKPNPRVVEQVQINIRAGLIPIWLSGRTAGCTVDTWHWLYENVIPPTPSGLSGCLYMRRVGDNRKDSIVKRELFDEFVRGRYNVRFVLDDRKQVVDMWRDELGLTCLQVAPGNF
jgi:predicted kinase